MFVNCLIAGLEDILSGSDVGRACERGSSSGGLMSLSSHSTELYTWSTRPPNQAALPTGGQPNGGLTKGVNQTGDKVLSCTSVPERSVMTSQLSVMSSRRPAPILSTLGSGRLSSGTSDSHRSCDVKLRPAVRSDVVSSGADVSRRRPSTAVELGSMHLRDLLSRDDDEPEVTQSRESPQEPQSTTCDDPPDSSTGNVRGSDTSILKQLLSDSDMEEHNEASVCEPETTHGDKESHVSLKVCSQQCYI